MIDISPNITVITLHLNELHSPREKYYDHAVLKGKNPHKTDLLFTGDRVQI